MRQELWKTKKKEIESSHHHVSDKLAGFKCVQNEAREYSERITDSIF